MRRWWRKQAMDDRFSRARHVMVERQLKRRGIRDSRVLAAMGQVPRELFVPEEVRDQCYEDRPLSIGFGQTISQPFVVAFMAESLGLTGRDRVLEIGTGSGYGAAILSKLAAEVHSVERIPALAEMAVSALRLAGCDNVTVNVADGSLECKTIAPFDAICVTAAAPALPAAYPQQLAPGGRIVIPIGSDRGQTMFRYLDTDGDLQAQSLGTFSFVPLIGAGGWPADR